jgi:ribonuclease HI
LFADDCLVFAQASASGATRLQNIFETYRIGSGQMVDRAKSAVFFSANCTNEMKQEVHEFSGIDVEALVEKYLGLPTALGRLSDDQFEHIITKLKKLVNSYAAKNLSGAVREVLVKAICQAIPTYSMSCFRLSKKMCKRITSIVARFWWGGHEHKQKIHWKKWSDIAIPKDAGGMGFRDFQLFNQAMLAKQGWRLMTKPDSLCAKVLRGKYYHGSDFLSATKKKNSLHVWRAILHGREALKKGLIKRVGDGSTIRIFDDPWIPTNSNGRPLCKPREAKAVRVDELIDTEQMCWSEEKLEVNLIETNRRAVCQIPLGRFAEDEWGWTQEDNGVFSVRSAYRMLSSIQQATQPASTCSKTCWKKLWKLLVPPKVRAFWWRVIKGFVPSRQVLNFRHVEKVGFCEACGKQEESIFHALFECTWARLFWSELKITANVKVPQFHPNTWAMDVIDSKVMVESQTSMILCGCWAAWQERNARKHGERGRSVTDSVRWAMQTSLDLSHSSREKPRKVLKPKEHWKPPAEGVIKINTDASFQEQEMTGGIGLVVRDHQGNLVRGQALWYGHAESALSMEALAIREGARLAQERGYVHVVIESDSLMAVNLCNADDQNRSKLRAIVQEIRDITRAFASFSILAVGREANNAAHLCAKHKRTQDYFKAWANSVKQC